MNDFKKNNAFKGGDKRGGGFQRGGFNGPQRGGNGGYRGAEGARGTTEMFQAVCAACQKSCEVPFRPNGKKPVYCKDCFAANGGQSASAPRTFDRSAPQRDFSRAPYKPAYNKPEYRPEHKPERAAAPDHSFAELKRSIEAMNTKLDKLVGILSERAVTAKKEDAAPNVSPKAPKKAAVKKAAPKKKK
ncbi:MAG: hypothetical protein JWN50_505 [Parcubacteria group bacterium]|nr:hypothetical protein [Parcubacteria group bacterium]